MSPVPHIVIVAAVARNNCIGSGNELPWHISDDLKRFKALTTGKPIVMGRKTWESLGSKPLPNRVNIVVTRAHAGTDTDSVMFVSSLEQAMAQAAMMKTSEIMVIGGAQIYDQTLPKAERLYITAIDADVEGDAFFPEIGDNWKLSETDGPHKDEKSGLSYSYKTYDRVR